MKWFSFTDRSSLKRKNEFADVPESGKRMRYMLGNTGKQNFKQCQYKLCP